MPSVTRLLDDTAMAGASQPVPLGKLDITLYRDDLSTIGPRPRVGETSLPDSIEGRTVVIVGQRVETQSDDRVDVAVRELDGRDAVELVRGAPL